VQHNWPFRRTELSSCSILIDGEASLVKRTSKANSRSQSSIYVVRSSTMDWFVLTAIIRIPIAALDTPWAHEHLGALAATAVAADPQ
jgi:hypothetical protein